MHCQTKKPAKTPAKKPATMPTKSPTRALTGSPTRAPTGAPTSLMCLGITGPMTAYNGHLYALFPFAVPQIWINADSNIKHMSCCGASGHLVTITDAAEKSFIHSLLAPGSTSGAPAYWIGLSDDAVDGTLAWTNGEPYDPTLLTFGIFNSAANDYAYAFASGGALVTNMDSMFNAAAGAIIEFDCP